MLESAIRRLGTPLRNVTDDDAGQGLVEYAFLIMFVALVVIVALELIGTNLNTYLEAVPNAFP